MSMRLSYELYNISYDKLIDYYYVIPYLYKKKRKKERWDQLSCLWWEKNADRAFSSRAWMAQISVTFCLEGPASSLCLIYLDSKTKCKDSCLDTRKYSRQGRIEGKWLEILNGSGWPVIKLSKLGTNPNRS